VAIIRNPNYPTNKGDENDPPTTTSSSTNQPQCYYLADPTLYEMEMADAMITIGMMPSWKEITCWEQQQQQQQ
jgi:exosome complex RNA-binding protein Rrp42 (RNase PH superfamily)